MYEVDVYNGAHSDGLTIRREQRGEILFSEKCGGVGCWNFPCDVWAEPDSGWAWARRVFASVFAYSYLSENIQRLSDLMRAPKQHVQVKLWTQGFFYAFTRQTGTVPRSRRFRNKLDDPFQTGGVSASILSSSCGNRGKSQITRSLLNPR